jgi:hypothetical protein
MMPLRATDAALFDNACVRHASLRVAGDIDEASTAQRDRVGLLYIHRFTSYHAVYRKRLT